MTCAVLSAVYDYDTDWVRTANPEMSMFFCELDRLLQNHPKRDEAIVKARELFQLDWERKLSIDGLERGSVALRFYWLVIESRWMSGYTAEQIDTFGRELQIVDDLLDLEKDRRAGDTNCFLTKGADGFVREGAEFLMSNFFRKLEENSRVYRLIRKTCHDKLKEVQP